MAARKMPKVVQASGSSCGEGDRTPTRTSRMRPHKLTWPPGLSRGSHVDRRLLAWLREWGELSARSCGPIPTPSGFPCGGFGSGASQTQKQRGQNPSWASGFCRVSWASSSALPGQGVALGGGVQPGPHCPQAQAPPGTGAGSHAPTRTAGARYMSSRLPAPTGGEHPSCTVCGRGPAPPDPFPCLNTLLPNCSGWCMNLT